MLLKKNEEGLYIPWDPLDNVGKRCYDLRALYRNLDMMTILIRYMQELGWSPYANDHEDANCQFEINWLYSDAMTTADRHTFFKWMVRAVAEQQGLWATFMPKPFSHLTGNGAHYNLSLAEADSGRNLFLDENAEYGLSQFGRWFMGGVLHHARGLSAITAPLVNSYKRLVRGAPRSGATWAPVYVTYGPANRTQMIRLPASGRIENRAVDGAANPYLASAAILGAGLDGIENKMEPGAANTANLYEAPEDELARRDINFLPTTLREALDCLPTPVRPTVTLTASRRDAAPAGHVGFPVVITSRKELTRTRCGDHVKKGIDTNSVLTQNVKSILDYGPPHQTRRFAQSPHGSSLRCDPSR